MDRPDPTTTRRHGRWLFAGMLTLAGGGWAVCAELPYRWDASRVAAAPTRIERLPKPTRLDLALPFTAELMRLPHPAEPVILETQPVVSIPLLERLPVAMEDEQDGSAEVAVQADTDRGLERLPPLPLDELPPPTADATELRVLPAAEPATLPPLTETPRQESIPPPFVAEPMVLPLPPAPVVAPADVVASDYLAGPRLQAERHLQHGCALAVRGATHAARAEFLQALQIVAQALDQQAQSRVHSESLVRGMRAQREAEDFVAHPGTLDADIDLAHFIAAHRTPVLKEADASRLSPVAALQAYFQYSQQQLAAAGGHEPAASDALYALGRLHAAEESTAPQSNGGTAKALALHQAALLVDASNFRAANELGVLLARAGQLADAERLFELSASVASQPDVWHNLAVVRERLGRPDRARAARDELARLMRSSDAVPGASPPSGTPVRWVSAQEFQQLGPGAAH